MRFLLFSVSVFLLTVSVFLACQIFEPAVTAQVAPEPITGFFVQNGSSVGVGRLWVMTSAGDVYFKEYNTNGPAAGPLWPMDNFWANPVVSGITTN